MLSFHCYLDEGVPRKVLVGPGDSTEAIRLRPIWTDNVGHLSFHMLIFSSCHSWGTTRLPETVKRMRNYLIFHK